MDERPSDPHIDTVNILIGEWAVKEKLITLEQLRLGLAEQLRDLGPDGTPSRSLGGVLLSLGFLTPSQLTSLLNRQHLRTRDPGTAARERSLLGQILVRRGQVRIEQVAEALCIQKELQDDGRSLVPRLGEIFITLDYATAEQIREALLTQEQARVA